ncbi:hypothetical protein ISS07_05040 [Candidatus Woesearchaeota archaeon]|nr:hypothetical protein [Candidatus Woesearchaeota archaeon]
MIKKITIAFLAILALFMFLGCSSQPAPEQDSGATEVITETPAETPVEEVAEEISEVDTTEEELDTSELNDLDSVLSDIENI